MAHAVLVQPVVHVHLTGVHPVGALDQGPLDGLDEPGALVVAEEHVVVLQQHPAAVPMVGVDGHGDPVALVRGLPDDRDLGGQVVALDQQRARAGLAAALAERADQQPPAVAGQGAGHAGQLGHEHLVGQRVPGTGLVQGAGELVRGELLLRDVSAGVLDLDEAAVGADDQAHVLVLAAEVEVRPGGLPLQGAGHALDGLGPGLGAVVVLQLDAQHVGLELVVVLDVQGGGAQAGGLLGHGRVLLRVCA